MIEQLRAEYAVSQLCQVLESAPSSFYYHPQAQGDAEALLVAMEQVLMRYPFYGYRRLQAELRRGGYEMGEHVARRLLKTLGGSRQVGRVTITTTDSKHNFRRFPNLIRGLKATYPNQFWMADITYIRLGLRFIYLAVILDAYTRGHSRLASGAQFGTKLNPDCSEKCSGKLPTAAHSSFRSGQPVCRLAIY